MRLQPRQLSPFCLWVCNRSNLSLQEPPAEAPNNEYDEIPRAHQKLPGFSKTSGTQRTAHRHTRTQTHTHQIAALQCQNQYFKAKMAAGHEPAQLSLASLVCTLSEMEGLEPTDRIATIMLLLMHGCF